MHKRDLEKAYKQAKNIMALYYKELGIKLSVKRRDIGTEIKRDVKIYLTIEKKIEYFYKYNDKITDKKVLFDRALEEIIGKLNLEDTKKENEIKKQYKKAYYKTAKRFHLPTVNNLKLYKF